MRARQVPVLACLGLPSSCGCDHRRCRYGPGEYGWLDTRTDTLLVDCDVKEVYRELWERLRRSGMLLPRQHVRGGDRGLVEARVWNGLGLAVAWALNGLLDDLKILGCASRVALAVLVVELSLTTAEAAASGLFGILGEERGVLVHLWDEGRLERLFSLQDKRLWGGDLRFSVQTERESWRCSYRTSVIRGDLVREERLATGDSSLVYLALSCYPVLHVRWSNPAKMAG